MGEWSHHMQAIVWAVSFNGCSNVSVKDLEVVRINFLSQQPKGHLTLLKNHSTLTDERQQMAAALRKNLIAAVVHFEILLKDSTASLPSEDNSA
jgi:hypothetical protein